MANKTALERLCYKLSYSQGAIRKSALTPVSCLSPKICSAERCWRPTCRINEADFRLINSQTDLHSAQSFKHVLSTTFSFLFLSLVCLTKNAGSKETMQAVTLTLRHNSRRLSLGSGLFKKTNKHS